MITFRQNSVLPVLKSSGVKNNPLFYKQVGLLCGLLTLASCTVIEPPPRAYPPAHQPPVQTNRPMSAPKPVTKPSSNKPVIKSTPKPGVVKPPVDEPEEGENPYDDVPQRTSASTPAATKPAPSSNVSTSPAVKSLLRQAKLDMVLKRNTAAISKLERALRIESRNPAIWHQLAKANYNNGSDGTAISMAKKSNIYTAADSPLEKLNWQLIKSASKRSGNIKSLKNAIRYERSHP